MTEKTMAKQDGGQRYRGQQCAAASDVALCSDDDWVSKCPSGCRLQGIISQMETDVEGKLRKVCKAARLHEDAAETSMTAMTQIYTSNRKIIVNRHVSELKFVEDASKLSRTLKSLRERSTNLSHQIKQLSVHVQKQIEDLYRTEVDIDMKLRACHGSCRSALPFAVDHQSYQTLQADVARTSAAAAPPEDVARVSIQTAAVSPAPSAEYKSIPAVRRKQLTLFEDIGQNELVLLDPVHVEAP